MPFVEHRSCYEGEAPTFVVGPHADQVVTDITGWTLSFVLSTQAEDVDVEAGTVETVITTKTIGSGIAILNALAGTFNVSLTTTDTNRTPGKYAYSIRRMNSGSESVLVAGTLTIKAVAGW